MKILFFSPYFYPYISGITVSPKRIVDYLKNSNDITILTFTHDKSHRKLTKSTKQNQITIHRIPYLFKLSKGFISPQSLIYYFKYAKNSELIILNQPNFEGLLLVIIGKLYRKKIVSIFHCQVFLEGNLLTKIVNSVLNISMKIQLNLSDKIITYTKDYIDSLPYFKKYTSKLFYILPPIFNPNKDKKYFNKLLNLKNASVWIGYAGRISSEKGLEYLIDAIKQLDNKTITLIFAGPHGKDVAGENAYYEKLIDLLKKNKIKYLFLGNLSNERLSAFYKSIDMLVLPSINQTEAFGMVQAEAMMAGTPVIASNLPGVRIPIKLTKMGIIVEPKNTEQISHAIKSILEHKNEFTNYELIKNAFHVFNIKQVNRFYDDLLTQL